MAILGLAIRCVVGWCLIAVTWVQADDHNETRRWAVVAADASQDGGFVDLLTAELSKDASYQLVERADVARILNELSLQASELVDPQRAVKFGQLASADAILIVEKAAEGDEAWRFARLVETKSGIQMWSGLAAQTDRADDVHQVLVKQLRAARDKMATQAARHYVGILDVKGEELDKTSDIFAKTVRLMLEHELQQSPQLVVLEREQAVRLLQERELTGIEVDLRTATTLIEGGVSRLPKSGERKIDLRFISPVNGSVKNRSIITAADDWERVRDRLRKECSEAIVMPGRLTTNSSGPDATANADEAALFRIRSEWRTSHRESDEAAALAEVAFALEPSTVNCDRLTSCYGGLIADSRRSTMERLQAAQRYHQVADFYLRRGLRADPKDSSYKYKFIFYDDYRPSEMEAAERRIFEDTRRLRQATFERELAERLGNGGAAVRYYVQRIEKSLYMTDTAEEFMGDLRVLITKLDGETAAGRFERTMANGSFKTFFGNLREQIQWAAKVIADPKMRHYGLLALPGDWGPEGIRPLLDWLAQHEDPRTRMLGHYGLCEMDGEVGNSAAHAILDTWLTDLTERDSAGRLTFSDVVDRAIERLRADGQFADYVDRQILAAERSGRVAPFCQWNSLAHLCMLNRHPPKTTEWCERIQRLLDTHRVVDAAVARKAQDLSRLLQMNLDRRYGRGDFAPKTDAGWEGYSVKRLAVRGATPHLKYLLRVAVDHEPDCERPIVAAWRTAQQAGKSLLDGSYIVVTRMGKYGGEVVEVGRFHKPGFSVTSMTVGGDNMYLGERTLGVAEVSPQGVRFFGQQQGLPQSQVECLAWLKPYLYIAYIGAIGRLDPQSGDFCLLASSRTVQPQNSLDSGTNYEVRSLLSDPENDCVWVCIYEPVIGPARSGIWKYTPGNEGFHHLHKDVVCYIARADEGLFLLSPKPRTTHDYWRIFHTDTETCRTLDGIGWSIDSGIQQPPGWAYLDGGVIGGNGRIHRPDGKNYQIDGGLWAQPIDRLGRGLVAVCFEKRAFWYIEPKAE
jgi:curli biogenesis system outer membrane secretion channel CsgG